MEKDNIRQVNTETLEKPKQTIFLRLFLYFLFFSIFTIASISLIGIWTFKMIDIELDIAEINALVSGFKDNFIFVILLVIIPTIFLSFRISEYIASPIRLITKNLKEVAKGNLDIETKTNRQDEFGNMIRLFNEMILRLKEVKFRNQEISKMKANFITVSSHQLRTPVAGVRFGLDILSSEIKGTLNEEQKKIVNECIQRNNETIKNIDDLLTTSKIEEDNFPYEIKSSSIKNLVLESLKEFEIELKVKHKTMQYADKLEKDINLAIDQARIKTVISNLIENAIEYGTKDTEIEVSLQKEGEYVLIQVENYGIGIKKEDEDNIFTQFFRADNAIATKPNGIGLGLYISKKIIDYHKGKIIASSSEHNNKTIFSVYLPIPKSLITEKVKTEEFLENI